MSRQVGPRIGYEQLKKHLTTKTYIDNSPHKNVPVLQYLPVPPAAELSAVFLASPFLFRFTLYVIPVLLPDHFYR